MLEPLRTALREVLSRFQTSNRWLWLALLAALVSLAGCSDNGPTGPGEPIPPPPPVELAPLDSTLDSQQELWSSMGIDSYEYRFRWLCFCLDTHVRWVDIRVHNGLVVWVEDAETGRDLGPEGIANYRTIDGLFDLVRQARDHPAASVLIGYDPELGYPAEAQIDWVAQMADDELAFRVYRLTPHRTQ